MLGKTNAAGILPLAGALVTIVSGAALAASGDPGFKRCVDDPSGPESCGRVGVSLNGANAVALSPDGRDAYVPAIVGNSIAHLRLNQRKGKLRPIDANCIDDNEGADTCPRQASALDGVGSAVVSPDGRFVYTTSSDQAIAIFKRHKKSGRLRPAGCIEDDASGLSECPRTAPGLLGVHRVLISPDGRAAYAASSADDAIAIFKRNRKTGKLRSRGCVEDGPRWISPDSSGCAQAARGLDSPSGLAFGPRARSLYYTGSLSDTVGRMQITPNRKLAPRECVGDIDTGTGGCPLAMHGLDGAGDLAFATRGRKRLYVAAGGGTEHAIAILRAKGRNGRLAPQTCLADADFGPPACPREAEGLQVVNGLALSRDQRHLYARASIDDSLVTLKRNLKSGRLADRGCIADDDAPAPGSDCAREAHTLNGGGSIAISPNGRWLFTASQIEDAVSVFRLAR